MTNLNDSVQEGDRVKEERPRRVVGVVQSILSDVGVRPLQAGPDALRRLVGELDGHLQQPDGEVLVDLGRHPQPEVLVDFLSIDDSLHDLLAELQRQVAVLQ